MVSELILSMFVGPIVPLAIGCYRTT